MEYIYQGYKVYYEINQIKMRNKFYRAKGSIIYHLIEENSTIFHLKFQTESSTMRGIQQEIKKIINNCIEFELPNFIEKETENS